MIGCFNSSSFVSFAKNFIFFKLSNFKFFENTFSIQVDPCFDSLNLHFRRYDAGERNKTKKHSLIIYFCDPDIDS